MLVEGLSQAKAYNVAGSTILDDQKSVSVECERP